jgi:hypothetical protein
MESGFEVKMLGLALHANNERKNMGWGMQLLGQWQK